MKEVCGSESSTLTVQLLCMQRMYTHSNNGIKRLLKVSADLEVKGCEILNCRARQQRDGRRAVNVGEKRGGRDNGR